jgi:hypothetical protein
MAGPAISQEIAAEATRIWQVLPNRNSSSNKELQNHMAGRWGSWLVETGESG